MGILCCFGNKKNVNFLDENQIQTFHDCYNDALLASVYNIKINVERKRYFCFKLQIYIQVYNNQIP